MTSNCRRELAWYLVMSVLPGEATHREGTTIDRSSHNG